MCCGKKRTEAAKPAETDPATMPEAQVDVQPQRQGDPSIYFQYVGTKGLTLIAPISGKRYRFNGPGAVVVADPRDKGALAGVSVLRQVQGDRISK